MRSVFVLIFVSCIFNKVYAQKVDELYGYKKDWSPADRIEVSTYIMHLIQEDDSTFSCRYYFTEGPLIKIETFKDSALEIPHGLFAWYNKNGDLDSMGNVYEKKKDGEWYLGFNEKWLPKSITHYDRGVFIKRVDHDKGIVYMPDGSTHFLNEENNLQKDNTLRVPSQFKSGADGWRKYLEGHLVIPERFNKIFHTRSKGLFKLIFEVDEQGKTGNIILLHSVEWSADTEVRRVVKESPLWIPATVEKHPVKHTQFQTVTLGLSW